MILFQKIILWGETQQKMCNWGLFQKTLKGKFFDKKRRVLVSNMWVGLFLLPPARSNAWEQLSGHKKCVKVKFKVSNDLAADWRCSALVTSSENDAIECCTFQYRCKKVIIFGGLKSYQGEVNELGLLHTFEKLTPTVKDDYDASRNAYEEWCNKFCDFAHSLSRALDSMLLLP
jgi:hypothetical protein